MSEFNGGLKQTFFVKYWISQKKNNRKRSEPVTDLEKPTSLKYVVNGILPGTNYSLNILASNTKGISVSETAACITDVS